MDKEVRVPQLKTLGMKFYFFVIEDGLSGYNKVFLQTEKNRLPRNWGALYWNSTI